MQKLLIASGIYPPDIGGPATYSQLIAREFIEQGINATIICYGDKKEELGDKEEKFKIKRILRKHNILVRYWLYFWNLFKLAKNADIIYAQGPVNSGFPAILVAKIFKKNILLRLGGDYVWERAIDRSEINLTLRQYYQTGIFKKQGCIFKIFKWVIKSVDTVIFSTEFQREIYLEYLGLNKEKTVVIRNAFPDFKEVSPDIPHNNQILFAGRIAKLKNLSLLIRVFSEIISTTNKDIQLGIIGDGDDLEKKRLSELVKKLRLENRVFFENRIPHQELLERIQGCYFAVLPSLTDISPNFVLECIKLNKPILCTKEIGFYKDFENNLVFFDPRDREDLSKKIRWLLEEKNYNDNKERMKRIKVERSWPELIKEHLLVFKNLK